MLLYILKTAPGNIFPERFLFYSEYPQKHFLF